MEIQTALITGASSGIGLELARIHARNGHNLVLVARSHDKLESLKQEIEKEHKVSVIVIPMDLSLSTAPEQLFAKLEGIEVDFLINNAGFGDMGFFYQTNRLRNRSMIDLNVQALTELTHLFLPAMIKRKSGRIMNVSSTAAFPPGPLMAVYYATKHYVQAFSEAVANELKGTGVTVTALCPGPTASNFANAANIGGDGLFDSSIPSSASVAQFGFNAMLKGKTVAIHGTKNRFLSFFIRFMPRKLVTNIVRKLHEK